MVSELLHMYVRCVRTDGWTDRSDATNGRFRNFAKAPNQSWIMRGVQQRIPRIKCDRTASPSRVTSHVRQNWKYDVTKFRSALTRRLQCSLNLLKPNDIYIYIYIYICRTTALTSRRYILNIYSTNIHTEYFKHAA